jgi:hypothetical protein
MARKVFSTTIDVEVLHEFRIACVVEGKNMNDVLEEFMRNYTKETLDHPEKKDPKRRICDETL